VKVSQRYLYRRTGNVCTHMLIYSSIVLERRYLDCNVCFSISIRLYTLPSGIRNFAPLQLYQCVEEKFNVEGAGAGASSRFCSFRLLAWQFLVPLQSTGRLLVVTHVRFPLRGAG
jgi:hypothetical protein